LKADTRQFGYPCVWICHSFQSQTVLNQAKFAN